MLFGVLIVAFFGYYSLALRIEALERLTGTDDGGPK